MPLIGENFIEKITKWFHKGYEYKNICQLLEKKYQVIASESNLKKLLKKYGLQRKNFEESPLSEILHAMDFEITSSGTNLGYRAMHQRLKQKYNLKVTRCCVMELMSHLDPAGVVARRRNKLKRRQYKAPGPNFILHVDGHDKLSMFGFTIHGAIDGYSRYCAWLELATTNHDPKVVAHHYIQFVKKQGFIPTIVRSDHGTENVEIGAMQIALRHSHDDKLAGFKSYIVGKSTHNQRIEAFWNHVQRLATGFYKEFFKMLVSKQELDIKNKIHIDCLNYCFGPLIKHDLENARKEWNSHRVRKQKSRDIVGGVPEVLYKLPENYGAYDYQKPVDMFIISKLESGHTSKPEIYTKDFAEIVQTFYQNLTIPSTVEEALEQYIMIRDALESIEM